MYSKTNKGFQLVPGYFAAEKPTLLEVKKTTDEEQSYPDYVIVNGHDINISPDGDPVRFLNRTNAEKYSAYFKEYLDGMFGEDNYDTNIVNSEIVILSEPDGTPYGENLKIGIVDANVDTDKHYQPVVRASKLATIAHQYIEVRVKNKLKPSLFKTEI